MNLKKYGQYKNDIFQKISFPFKKGKKILDVGCGDCTDVEIFIKEFELDTYGIDIYEHRNTHKLKKFRFKKDTILKIPYPNETFDYVFLHDILHHIDEKNQSYKTHIHALKELKRITVADGYIIILEANRYNPLFYPHMVILNGHNHFRQSYFMKIIKYVYRDQVTFKFFEAHLYPKRFLPIFKVFEFISENLFFLSPFRAYNLAIIKKTS